MREITKMKINKDQRGSFLVLAVAMFVVIAVFGVFAFQAVKESTKGLYASEETSLEASNKFEKKNIPTGTTAVAQPTPPSPDAASPSPTKAIVGNSDTTKKPELPATVSEPVSPKDSITTFINAFKNGDFVTANALISTDLAQDIATLSGAQDPSQALQACQANFVCSTILGSFGPPAKAKETFSTSQNGMSVVQYSFLLSQTNKNLTNAIGDRNIDVFMVSHSGVWVIHDLYIDGQSLLVAL